MSRYTVTWEARPLDENGQPMGSTVVGQEDADFETIPEGTATDELKAAKAEHLFLEGGLTYEVKIVGYRDYSTRLTHPGSDLLYEQVSRNRSWQLIGAAGRRIEMPEISLLQPTVSSAGAAPAMHFTEDV
jgi:hypothetical protein